MLNNETVYNHIRNKMELGKFKVSIGSSNVSYNGFLAKDNNETDLMTGSDSESD